MSQSATAILDQQELLDTLKAFKKGDFTVRMTTHGGGVVRDIADTLNGLIELNQRLTKDLQRLSKAVGKDGKVTERASRARSARKASWGARRRCEGWQEPGRT